MPLPKMPLPISFELNTFDRMIEFLNESNRIEGIHEIDYRDPNFQKFDEGHFAALVQSQENALENEKLSIQKIEHWQGLLAQEQIPLGHIIDKDAVGHVRSPDLPRNVKVGARTASHYSQVLQQLDALIDTINERLRSPDQFQDDVKYCQFLGSVFQRFEEIHPFVDGNGRVGRLIVNYIATYCKRPLIIFRSESSERNEYNEAHKSSKAMIQYMAKKIQEVIFGLNGDLLVKSDDLSGATSRYKSTHDDYQELYEWHELKTYLTQVS